MTIEPVRASAQLWPDPRRVVARAFMPGEWATVWGPTRLQTVLDRVLAIPDDAVPDLLTAALAEFGYRHRHLERVLRQRAAHVLDRAHHPVDLSDDLRLLIGAYFTNEYALEASALTNPSMVPHPDGSPGRFVLSLRAIGEGHISSIEFRTGQIGADGAITLDPPSPFCTLGQRRPPLYDRALFGIKLRELGADPGLVSRVLEGLDERFTLAAIEEAISNLYDHELSAAVLHETARMTHWLASSNYIVSFDPATDLSERALFPAGSGESAGMEDARFVRFDDAGSPTYYATYTAYDGFEILPQLIETADFTEFRIATLNGPAARNKGMAVFPRKLDGHYAALARQDRESIYFMTSDNVRFWNDHELVYQPQQPWELVQTGNCGSPIETSEGWLVLTHGVGAMRRYALGALLLDRGDPTRVLGYLREPLLEPEPGERDGYVPNVVYSCGGMVHDGTLVVPYGFADVGCGFALYDLEALLSAFAEAPSTRS